MSQPFNENIRRCLRLADEMIALADDGDRDRVDESCAVLYGILRDTGYRIKRLAEEECARHEEEGKWD